MCILIFKKAGVKIPEERLRNCMSRNSDGAGFAVVEEENGKNELNIYKGAFDFDTFYKAYQLHEDKQMLLHFRIATHYLVDGKNCHPFRVNNDLVLAHNGKIHDLPYSAEWTDTAVFAQHVIKPLAKINPDFWLSEQYKWFIENAISSSNKVIMMDSQNRYVIFNEKQGEWVDDVWYSNSSYKGYTSCNNNWKSTTQQTEKPKDKVIEVEAEVTTPTTDKEDLSLEEKKIENDFTPFDLQEIDAAIAAANQSK